MANTAYTTRQMVKNNLFFNFTRFFQSDILDKGSTRNNIAKKCIDCKYYKIGMTKDRFDNIRYDWVNAKCLKYKLVNTDSLHPQNENEKPYLSAYVSRSEKSLCGPKGKFYHL
jgi:hypothetical protein